MPSLIGTSLALAIGGFARWIGLDRDRAFYATVVMVVASYYVLFAAAGGLAALPAELFLCGAFVVLAAIGFKKSPWLIVAGLVAHGVLDLFHPHMVNNSGAPPWWPAFCGAYDVTAGAWLALLLVRARRHHRRHHEIKLGADNGQLESKHRSPA
jgi:hypothetical protein